MRIIGKHSFKKGSSYCTMCKGGHASLPTECPQVELKPQQIRGLEAGKLDFINNKWTVK